MMTDDTGCPVLVVGAGGHARVVIDILLATGRPIAALAGRPGESSADLSGALLLQDDDEALALARKEGWAFVVAIGDNARRRDLYARFAASGLRPATLCHHQACLLGGACCGPGTVVGASAVIGVAARIGCNAIINTGAIVEHDCFIGDHVHIAPGSRLGGMVEVAEGALVGLAATVLPGLRIGRAAVVGAGAVVVAEVPAGATVVGVPARAIERRRVACTTDAA